MRANYTDAFLSVKSRMSPTLYSSAFVISAIRCVVLTAKLSPETLASVLEGTGVSESELMDGDGYLNWAQVHALTRNILALPNIDGLALRAGARVLPSLHGPMGIAAMASATLGDAFEVFRKYMETRSQVLAVTLQHNEQSCDVIMHLLPERDVVTEFLSQSIVASCFACTEFLLGEPLHGVEVAFAWSEPADLSAYRDIFNDNILLFDQPNTLIRVPTKYVTKSLSSRDGMIQVMASQQCEAILESLKRQGSLSAQILDQLRKAEGALPSLLGMSEMLNMSQRTLIRRLKAEDTRYQSLLDAETSRRAVFLLTLPSSTVASVAAQLGYAEPASFRRAFHRWFGVAPSDFRGK